MNLMEAILGRKSIRGYKPDPVPRPVISEILETAVKSPSAMNTQPWEFTVVAGEVLSNICRDNIEKLLSGTSPHTLKSTYQGIYRQRQVELAIDIFRLMDIKREDQARRAEWMQRGFRFFDAPAAIIVCTDESLAGTWSLFDAGAVSQTICLAALKYGLGTCIEDQGVMFPEVIKKHTGLPETKQIVIGIAIGYPDWDFPANQLISRREPVENITSWHGF